MFQFSSRFFLSTFRLSNRTPKIMRILTLYQANVPTLMRCNFFKHIPNLIILGTHNLQTFKDKWSPWIHWWVYYDITEFMVTTCLEKLKNLEMWRNYMLWISLKVRELSGKKSCHGKLYKNFPNKTVASTSFFCISHLVLCANYFVLFIAECCLLML